MYFFASKPGGSPTYTQNPGPGQTYKNVVVCVIDKLDLILFEKKKY